ncbi:MAG UNVERIFIED_CONTAM: hypothetical protein LVT10_14765 [Anaerolineae bacterium]
MSSIQRIDQSVRRILSAKVRYGVMGLATPHARTSTRIVGTIIGWNFVETTFSNEGTTVVYDDYNLLNQAPDPQSKVLLIYPFERLESVRYCQEYRPSTWIVRAQRSTHCQSTRRNCSGCSSGRCHHHLHAKRLVDARSSDSTEYLA